MEPLQGKKSSCKNRILLLRLFRQPQNTRRQSAKIPLADLYPLSELMDGKPTSVYTALIMNRSFQADPHATAFRLSTVLDLKVLNLLMSGSKSLNRSSSWIMREKSEPIPYRS